VVAVTRSEMRGVGGPFIGWISRAIGMHADRIDDIAHTRRDHLTQKHTIVNRVDLVVDAYHRRRTADDRFRIAECHLAR